ncbi:MAG: hypothetical protein F4213_05540 [Boseongicola sp. SB0677_bin_26]|nr:hypothetical protein [Boseongicola sp. SB0677_bin_26]
MPTSPTREISRGWDAPHFSQRYNSHLIPVALPATTVREAGGNTYFDGPHHTLAGLWRKILTRRAPNVAAWFDASTVGSIPAGACATPCLHALTIWFQRQHIADENIAIRDRRQAESNAGAASAPGSFAQVPASADIDAMALEANA